MTAMDKLRNSNGLFITATGTDVGKTYVTTLLIRQLRAQQRQVLALKPILSGLANLPIDHSDTARLLSAMGDDITPDTQKAITPWTFQRPLSPDMAARMEGTDEIDFNALIHLCQDQLYSHQGTVLIEGVGGVMVPINTKMVVADWIAALHIPALLVTSSRLGTLSHTLTAVECLKSRGIPLHGIILSEAAEETIPLEETHTSLTNFLPDVPIRCLHRSPLSADDHIQPDLTDLLLASPPLPK